VCTCACGLRSSLLLLLLSLPTLKLVGTRMLTRYLRDPHQHCRSCRQSFSCWPVAICLLLAHALDCSAELLNEELQCWVANPSGPPVTSTTLVVHNVSGLAAAGPPQPHLKNNCKSGIATCLHYLHSAQHQSIHWLACSQKHYLPSSRAPGIACCQHCGLP
jgi:hypothetical protein